MSLWLLCGGRIRWVASQSSAVIWFSRWSPANQPSKGRGASASLSPEVPAIMGRHLMSCNNHFTTSPAPQQVGAASIQTPREQL